MTELQRSLLRASEIRKRLSELAGIAELDDEQRAEIGTLRTEYQDVELRVQAGTVAEDQPTETDPPADRRLAELEARASAGDVFDAALNHGQTDGATRELQDHLGLQGNAVPLALLRQPAADGVESRAVTPSPTDVGTNQQQIIEGVFPMACATFLGIDMPTVAVGETVFPVLATNATAGVPDEDAEQDETTGSFDAEVLSPARIQASFFFSRESRARFAMLEASLRQNLSAALSDKLDQQILNGDEGLFEGTNLPNNNASAVTTFAGYMADLAYGRVDGKYAADLGDLRVVMGSSTFAHAGTTYRHQNADDLAIDRLRAVTAGVKVSAHVPPVAASKQNAVVRLGMRRDMVAAIWEGITLIPDEVTLAKKGQIQITAVMLHAVKILRAAGFYKQQTQHA